MPPKVGTKNLHFILSCDKNGFNLKSRNAAANWAVWRKPLRAGSAINKEFVVGLRRKFS